MSNRLTHDPELYLANRLIFNETFLDSIIRNIKNGVSPIINLLYVCRSREISTVFMSALHRCDLSECAEKWAREEELPDIDDAAILIDRIVESFQSQIDHLQKR